MPTAQLVHETDARAPDTDTYRPATQLVHNVNPVTEAYVPALQLVHPLDPVTACADPIAQLTHAVADEELENLPAAQPRQVADAAVEYVPMRHAVQLVDPEEAEILPAEHATHVASDSWE